METLDSPEKSQNGDGGEGDASKRHVGTERGGDTSASVELRGSHFSSTLGSLGGCERAGSFPEKAAALLTVHPWFVLTWEAIQNTEAAPPQRFTHSRIQVSTRLLNCPFSVA